jgi:glyoxylase-like metal-dependent hydrolase (beta-lactamase superfamily II)
MNCSRILINGLAWASLGTFIAAGVAQAPAPAPFVTHQLKPNIYWIEGGGGNSTVIVGTKGVIVVDAKTTTAGGQELLDDIAKITPKPVTTVILTHSDGDHVNGLAAFPAGVKVIAQENNKKEQEAALAAGGRGAPPADHLPTQVVTKEKETLTIEGEKLELYHWAPAHTSGDLIIYLPKYKIVATGDIIATNNPYPRIHDEKNGSTEGWITTAKGMVTLDADTFIPGHGTIQAKADIQKRIADAEARRNQVKELVAQGKSLDEIKAAVGDTDKLNYKSWTQVCYEEMTKK